MDNVNIRVSSFTFPPVFLDFSSLWRLRKDVIDRLKRGGQFILDERIIDEEDVWRFVSLFGVKRCSALVDVYRDENGVVYREYLLIGPRHLVSRGWIRVLGILLIRVMGGIYRGIDLTGRFKCGLVLLVPELGAGKVMCMTYSEAIYRDVFGFVNEGGFSDRLEYERVVRPGEVRESVLEVGVSDMDVWGRFIRSGGRSGFRLELVRRLGESGIS